MNDFRKMSIRTKQALLKLKITNCKQAKKFITSNSIEFKNFLEDIGKQSLREIYFICNID